MWPIVRRSSQNYYLIIIQLHANGCLKLNSKATKEIDKFKAWLMAQGFN